MSSSSKSMEIYKKGNTPIKQYIIDFFAEKDPILNAFILLDINENYEDGDKYNLELMGEIFSEIFPDSNVSDVIAKYKYEGLKYKGKLYLRKPISIKKVYQEFVNDNHITSYDEYLRGYNQFVYRYNIKVGNIRLIPLGRGR